VDQEYRQGHALALALVVLEEVSGSENAREEHVMFKVATGKHFLQLNAQAGMSH